jgi:crotonobetainyl-CoA:carnitine CoA-transferase CaiB-like acyl-CoA transferase
MMGLGAMLAAVIQRDKTGRGQFVDVSMFDGALAAATMVFANVAGGLETPGPGRMFLNGLFPCYNVYETSDGKHMVLGAIEAKFWREFCLAVNRPDLVEGHYGDQRIVAEVRKIFAGRTREEWTALFREHDACCEPLLGLDEAADSELTRARDMIVQDAQGRRFLGCPLKLSDTVIPEMTPAPGLGRDTREVLAGKLGLSTETIDSLVKDGAIRG